MKIQYVAYILIFLLLFSCGAVTEIFDPVEAPIINKLTLSPDTVYPLDTVMAVVDAVNPESGLLKYSWTSTNGAGRFVEPSDKDTIYWTAPSNGGDYYLTVNVSNSEKTSSFAKKVHVISLAEPLVDIQKPSTDDYFILYDDIKITTIAIHDNGLEWVRLVVITEQGDSSAIDTLAFNTVGKYYFTFQSFTEMVGTSTIMIEAKANGSTDIRGKDFVKIKIEGILPGGNEH